KKIRIHVTVNQDPFVDRGRKCIKATQYLSHTFHYTISKKHYSSIHMGKGISFTIGQRKHIVLEKKGIVFFQQVCGLKAQRQSYHRFCCTAKDGILFAPVAFKSILAQLLLRDSPVFQRSIFE